MYFNGMFGPVEKLHTMNMMAVVFQMRAYTMVNNVNMYMYSTASTLHAYKYLYV